MNLYDPIKKAICLNPSKIHLENALWYIKAKEKERKILTF